MSSRVSWCALVIVVAGLATPPLAHAQGDGAQTAWTAQIFVEGDVSKVVAPMRWVSFVANSPVNPMAPRPQDPCHVDIELRDGDVKLRLTAILEGGLPANFMLVDDEREFYLGRINEPFGVPWEDERRVPGAFFATLDLGPSEKRRIDVRTIPGSGTFRSIGVYSRLRLEHFDGSILRLNLTALMEENIGTRYHPRRIDVQAELLLQWDDTPFSFEGDDHQQWRDAVPFSEVFQFWGIDPEMVRHDPSAAVTIYRCGNLAEVKQAAADAAAAPESSALMPD